MLRHLCVNLSVRRLLLLLLLLSFVCARVCVRLFGLNVVQGYVQGLHAR